jgi:hypothetical protein
MMSLCSFCGAEEDLTAGRRLISGPNDVAICISCVRLASKAIDEDLDGEAIGDGWIKQVRRAER